MEGGSDEIALFTKPSGIDVCPSVAVLGSFGSDWKSLQSSKSTKLSPFIGGGMEC